jgi:hypothetical protein
MKKKYFVLLIIIGTSICSVEQECIIKPKTKKTYVSEQQCAEVDGGIVVSGNNVQGAAAKLQSKVSTTVKGALDRVGNHINGEKSGLNKVERTECYEKKMKIKQELDRITEDIKKMTTRLESLAEAL